jgi:hypothetical protein
MVPATLQTNNEKQWLPGIFRIAEGDETKEILFYDLFTNAASNPQVMHPYKRNNEKQWLPGIFKIAEGDETKEIIKKNSTYLTTLHQIHRLGSTQCNDS